MALVPRLIILSTIPLTAALYLLSKAVSPSEDEMRKKLYSREAGMQDTFSRQYKRKLDSMWQEGGKKGVKTED